MSLTKVNAWKVSKDGSTQVLLDENQKKSLKIMGQKTIEENLIEIKIIILDTMQIIFDIVINLALSHCNDKISKRILKVYVEILLLC